MFFQVYGANALPQWGMMLVVLAGLILLNEFARRTKFGGIFTFLVVPVALTAYFSGRWKTRPMSTCRDGSIMPNSMQPQLDVSAL